ncbi:placental prolactin-related protein 1-like [Dama dama]
MASAPNLRGHQWTYNPLRGSCLLLLLVMSNLLLCQGNLCPSCSPDMFKIPLKSLKALFTRAFGLSHDINNLSTMMFLEFNEDLSKWILMLLYSWDIPLNHLVMDLRNITEVSNTTLSRARETVKKVQKLKQLIERQFNQVIFPARKKMVDTHVYWTELQSLTSRDENIRHHAFFILFRCLHRDTRKVDIYTKIMACRIHNVC